MQKDSKVYLIVGLILAVVIIGLVIFVVKNSNSGPGKYDLFATALKNDGAVFYGAFWCPHCQAEKARFGSSEKFLPYVECSTPDGQGQTQVCKDKGIQSYPTWQFANSTTTVNGELELSDLAQRTSCPLPQ